MGKLLRVVSFIVLGAVSASAGEDSTLPYYGSADFTPHWMSPGSEEWECFHRIPSFSFVDQAGETVDERSVDGHIYVANFFFTSCPGICPPMQARLADVRDDALGGDPGILFLSHSVTPTADTVDVLAEYAAENGIDGKTWHLLTGPKKSIYDIARNHYFAEEDMGATTDNIDFLHTSNVLLIDGSRRIRGIYNGLNDTSMQLLVADIRTLKGEEAR